MLTPTCPLRVTTSAYLEVLLSTLSAGMVEVPALCNMATGLAVPTPTLPLFNTVSRGVFVALPTLNAVPPVVISATTDSRAVGLAVPTPTIPFPLTTKIFDVVLDVLFAST